MSFRASFCGFPYLEYVPDYDKLYSAQRLKNISKSKNQKLNKKSSVTVYKVRSVSEICKTKAN